MKQMKLTSTFLLIIFSCLVFGQEDTKKINYSAFLQTGPSYRTTNVDYSYPENPAGVYGGGLMIAYKLNKLKIQSGVQYQQYAILSRFEGLVFGNQINHQTGNVSANKEFDAVSFKYLHQYITVPLGVNYNLFQFGSKNSIHVSAGIAGNFYLNSKNIVKKYKAGKTIDRKTENYTFDARKVSLSSYYAITYERAMKNKSFFVGSKFDVFHNPNTNSTTIKRTPYKFSLLVGIGFYTKRTSK